MFQGGSLRRKNKSKTRGKWRYVFLLLLGIILFGLIRQDEYGLTAYNHAQDVLTENDWVSWVHPLGDGVGRVVRLGPFDSLSECENRSWTHMNENYEGWEEAVYYCGYSCTETEHARREETCRVVR